MIDDPDPTWHVIAIFWATVFILGGVGLLWFTHRRWYGRSRQWAIGSSGPAIVYMVPTVAVWSIGLGIAFATTGGPARIIIGVLVVVGVAGAISHAVEPRWWGPSWYHQLRHELDFPNLEEFDPGREAREVEPVPGSELSSQRLAEELFDCQPVVDSSRCYLIHEPNKGLRKYGVRHVLQLSGGLEIRPAGLAFVPGRATEKMRGGPHVVPIEAGEVQRVWVVPPGAEPDGYRRVGLPREIWSRIVVKTEEEMFLFSVPQAQERAKTISEVLGCPLGT